MDNHLRLYFEVDNFAISVNLDTLHALPVPNFRKLLKLMWSPFNNNLEENEEQLGEYLKSAIQNAEKDYSLSIARMANKTTVNEAKSRLKKYTKFYEIYLKEKEL